MKQLERQKMCPNCDGRIPQEATQCPYCFAQLQAENNSPKSMTNDPLSALYSPSYSSETKNSSKSSSLPDTSSAEKTSEPLPFWSILMLALGSNLLTLGILQFFFSEHGKLYLEMNASYWFLMIIIATPLIYFGLKNLSSKE